jgi:ElaB/YqjD/DUF883 family membrane-anchored ribosome-binding protein
VAPIHIPRVSAKLERFALRQRCQLHSSAKTKWTNQMTNTERSTHPSVSNAYGSSDSAHAPDAPKDDIAAKTATAFREAKANVENVIADAGEKGQQALNYAGKTGQEALDNVRAVGDTVAVAVEKSVTRRPYTTLALAVAAGFLLGATWRR